MQNLLSQYSWRVRSQHRAAFLSFLTALNVCSLTTGLIKRWLCQFAVTAATDAANNRKTSSVRASERQLSKASSLKDRSAPEMCKSDLDNRKLRVKV